MGINELKELMETFGKTNMVVFKYKTDVEEICMEKEESTYFTHGQVVQLNRQQDYLEEEEIVPQKQEKVEAKVEKTMENVVKSPLVGTFYSSPSPDAEPFVKVGDTVKKGQVLGIIEAMKLMNDIESDFDGEIVEIMVNNKDMVEYDQPLFKIK